MDAIRASKTYANHTTGLEAAYGHGSGPSSSVGTTAAPARSAIRSMQASRNRNGDGMCASSVSSVTARVHGVVGATAPLPSRYTWWTVAASLHAQAHQRSAGQH